MSKARSDLHDQLDKLLDLAEQQAAVAADTEQNLKIRIEGLEKQLEARLTRLNEINADLEARNKEREQQKQALAELDRTKGQKEAAYAERIASLERRIAQLSTESNGLKAEAKDALTQLRENKQYLAEQEKLAEQTLAEWNGRVNEMYNEGKVAEENKIKLLGDVYRLEQQKEQLIQNTESQKQVQATLTEAAMRAHYDAIEAAKRDLEAIKQESESLRTKNAAAEQGFLAREREVSLKEASVRARENKVAQDERYIQSRLSMVQ